MNFVITFILVRKFTKAQCSLVHEMNQKDTWMRAYNIGKESVSEVMRVNELIFLISIYKWALVNLILIFLFPKNK